MPVLWWMVVQSQRRNGTHTFAQPCYKKGTRMWAVLCAVRSCRNADQTKEKIPDPAKSAPVPKARKRPWPKPWRKESKSAASAEKKAMLFTCIRYLSRCTQTREYLPRLWASWTRMSTTSSTTRQVYSPPSLCRVFPYQNSICDFAPLRVFEKN